MTGIIGREEEAHFGFSLMARRTGASGGCRCVCVVTASRWAPSQSERMSAGATALAGARASVTANLITR